MTDINDFIDKYQAEINSGNTELLCELIQDNLDHEDASTLIDMLLDEDFDIIKHLKEKYSATHLFNAYVAIEDLEESLTFDFTVPTAIPKNPCAKTFAKYCLKNYDKTGFDAHNPNSTESRHLLGNIESIHVGPYLYGNQFYARLIIEDKLAHSFELLKLLEADKFLTIYSKIGYGCNPDAIEEEFLKLQKFMNAFIDTYNLEVD